MRATADPLSSGKFQVAGRTVEVTPGWDQAVWLLVRDGPAPRPRAQRRSRARLRLRQSRMTAVRSGMEGVAGRLADTAVAKRTLVFWHHVWLAGREIQTLRLASLGMTNRQIGETLWLSWVVDAVPDWRAVPLLHGHDGAARIESLAPGGQQAERHR